MKLVIQRVNRADVKIDGKEVGKINKGLLVFVGVAADDDEKVVEKYFNKLIKLRIFEDENGKMNVDIKAVDGEILLISQFTLYADCTHGNRPGFTKAGNPTYANEMYEKFGQRLKDNGMTVKTGVFGADMRVDIQNVGPVTIMLDSKELLKK